MQEVVTAIQGTSDFMAQITAASVEQSQGIGQLNAAISQMEEMTQATSGLVEQAEVSAHNLKELAQGLGEVVDTFTLESPAQQPHRPHLQIR
jgi:methyl-accepting chemotaxis protein